MSEHWRVVLATDEDLLRDFGEAKLLIGLPVRPTTTTPPAPSEVRGASSAGGKIGPGSRRRSRIEGPEGRSLLKMPENRESENTLDAKST